MAYENEGVVDKLSKLENLRSSNALTADEFDKLKRSLIENESRNEHRAAAQGRPVGVYIVFLLAVIATPLGVLYGALELSGHVPLSDAGRNYYQHIKPLSFLNQSGIIFTEVAAICLFNLRKVAIPLYLAAMATSWADVAWNIIANGLMDYAPVSVAVGLFLDVLVLMYMIYLSSENKLN